MKFILTKELGRLARWVRILGFDSEYFTQDKESTLIIKALQEERIILTRNVRLGRHPGIRKLHISSNYLSEQLRQALRELQIKPNEALMFTRCIICNEPLANIEKEKVKTQVPEYVFKTQSDFVRCPVCKRIYWQGSHWGKVAKTLEEITR